MPSVVYTQGAIRDLNRLRLFLASKSQEASSRASQTIISGMEELEQHPQIGKPTDDMDPEYRELLIGFGKNGYAILYHVAQNEIKIVAIRHQLEAGYS